jgi:hypothetical protein
MKGNIMSNETTSLSDLFNDTDSNANSTLVDNALDSQGDGAAADDLDGGDDEGLEDLEDDDDFDEDDEDLDDLL